MSLKNSNDTIGNRIRDLPVCSVVPVKVYIVTQIGCETVFLLFYSRLSACILCNKYLSKPYGAVTELIVHIWRKIRFLFRSVTWLNRNARAGGRWGGGWWLVHLTHYTFYRWRSHRALCDVVDQLRGTTLNLRRSYVCLNNGRKVNLTTHTLCQGWEWVELYLLSPYAFQTC